MPKIPLSHILILDRQRYDLGDIETLAASLAQHGQIQPVLLRKSDNRLIAGGRRCAAALHLGWHELEYIYREDCSDDILHELELEENVRRKEMTWQEQAFAITKIHELKTRKAALSSSDWGQQQTAEMLGFANKSAVSTAYKITQRLRRDPTKQDAAWKCSSAVDCIRLCLKEQEDLAVAELNRRSLALLPSGPHIADQFDLDILPQNETSLNPIPNSAYATAQTQYLSNSHNDPTSFDAYYTERLAYQAQQAIAKTQIPLSRTLMLGDSIHHMRESPSVYDHIITDIPYAIDMDMLTQENTGMRWIESVRQEHDVNENLALIEAFFPAAFYTLKDKGFCVTFGDLANWQLMSLCAEKAGFCVQRWPFLWIKPTGMNQAAQYNFTKNYEIAIICRKPGTLLANHSPTSHLLAGRDILCDRILHLFAKPFAVWEFLYTRCTSPHDLILDPFAGRGSGVISGLRLGRRVVGVELQETHYNHLVENVKQHYVETLGENLLFT